MTLKWMLHRITHRKRTCILLGLLLIGFSITGGVTKYYSADYDLMVLNVAFATNFDTVEAWQSWHSSWQFAWLVSAISMVGLWPFMVNIIPRQNDPELTVPVTMGQSRSSIFFAQLICYDLAAIILWFGYLVVGCLFGRIPVWSMFSAGYYFRTIGYALLLQLGYANLALALVLLFKNRMLGIAGAFTATMLISILKNMGLIGNILFHHQLCVPWSGCPVDVVGGFPAGAVPSADTDFIPGGHHGAKLSGGADFDSPPGSCLKGGAP